MTKKKILMFGHSPLPIENTNKHFAPGLRTWHFINSAIEVGCEILAICCRIPNAYGTTVPEIKFEKTHGIQYYSVSERIFKDEEWMKNVISKFQPDCVVGINVFPASMVADLDVRVPFWADLNGSVMAEAQAKANLYNDDSYLEHFFEMESKILSKADVFSVVSEAQGFSLIGELGLWGRLNKNTMGYRFVRFIPNVSEHQKFTHTKTAFRGKQISDTDFVILYSGGYNTWTDINTLFHGIEKAMSKNPKIVFVSTGGQITGHDDITYERFKRLIKKSRFNNRFHLFGWVPFSDLPNYYLESDLAINSDRYCYEAIIGARTRILDWVRAKLPYISTPLSEITNYMVNKGLAYSFKQGNSDDLAEKLLRILNSPEDLKRIKDKLESALFEEFTAVHAFKEFKLWLQDPQFSPDYGKIRPLIFNVNKQNSIPAMPLLQHVAIVCWPKISRFLHLVHMSRFETKIQNFGIRMITRRLRIYKAKIKVLSVPTLYENEKSLLPTEIQNIGNCEWPNPKESMTAVNLSYMWKDKTGNPMFKFEERTPLSRTVKPKQSLKIDLMLTSPPAHGDYILEIDLVKEKEFWFSDVGSIPYRIKLSVKKKQDPIYDLPKVSVIIVTYNSSNYIDACITSILQSDYPDFEVIIVDNASTDNTLQKLDKYKNNIKLIRNSQNLGFGAGNNMGIRNSSGEIIVMINPDAFVTESAIKELILPMLKDPQIMITGSKILYPGTTKIQSAGGMIKKNALPYHLGYGMVDSQQFNCQRNVDYVTGAAMAVHSKLFEITGLFNPVYAPAYFEETDKCLRARKLGYKVAYIPNSVVFHHESTTLRVFSKKYLIHFHTNRFRFVYKNYNILEYLTKFIPFEIKWFLFDLSTTEKLIVAKAHIKIIFSLYGVLTTQSPKLL